MNNYQPQNGELITFLIVLAVVFVVVVVIAAFALVRRNQRGDTVQKSTFGNNIDEGKDVGPARTREPRGSGWEQSSSSANRSSSDTRRDV